MSRALESRHWAEFTFVLNGFLVAGCVLVYLASKSQLVLAQGADSVMDVAAGMILVVSANVGSQPRDLNHPFGHHRAEPIGALVTAILAGVLGVEVVRNSVDAIVTHRPIELDRAVLLILSVKMIVKLAVFVSIRIRGKIQQSPAMHALMVDAKNDVVATVSSVIGFFLVRRGLDWADAALAVPVGIYIGVNGFRLARMNVRYLMGEAPEPEVLDELKSLAGSVRGVRAVTNLLAHYVGNQLHVQVTILIDGSISATQGHDIGVAVQQAVESHPLVSQAFVHIDTPAGVEHVG